MDYTIFPHKTNLLLDSHVLGHIECSYDRLVEMFNLPFAGDDKYTDCEWDIMLMNGHPVSIYNYRNGRAYNGNDGLANEDIRNWVVGGHYDYDFAQLQEFIEGKTIYTFSISLEAQNKELIIKSLESTLEHVKNGQETGTNWKITKEKVYEE